MDRRSPLKGEALFCFVFRKGFFFFKFKGSLLKVEGAKEAEEVTGENRNSRGTSGTGTERILRKTREALLLGRSVLGCTGWK